MNESRVPGLLSITRQGFKRVVQSGIVVIILKYSL